MLNFNTLQLIAILKNVTIERHSNFKSHKKEPKIIKMILTSNNSMSPRNRRAPLFVHRMKFYGATTKTMSRVVI